MISGNTENAAAEERAGGKKPVNCSCKRRKKEIWILGLLLGMMAAIILPHTAWSASKAGEEQESAPAEGEETTTAEEETEPAVSVPDRFMTVGEKQNISVKRGNVIRYTSENPRIVSVNGQGELRAKKRGTVQIQVQTDEEECSLVIVVDPKIKKSYIRCRKKAQICGITAEELQKLAKKFARKTKKWKYCMVVDDPVWEGGRRWDCSSMVVCFYNNYLLPYAKKQNRPLMRITDEKGKKLKRWGYYPYLVPKGGILVNNTTTILSQVGVPWSRQRVTRLWDAWQTSLSVGTLDESLLPAVGDLLLYGKESTSGKCKVQHVAVFLGEYKGRGNGWWMLECTTKKSRKALGIKKKEIVGDYNGAAINPFWTVKPKSGQKLIWVKKWILTE